jgi:hypothetical protein
MIPILPPGMPGPDDPGVRRIRGLFLVVVTGSTVFLVPWIAYLAVTLPTHHIESDWKPAWVGFDVALAVTIGLTAIFAWTRRQLFIPFAIITATLLCCDAWFDIVLDWGTRDLAGSLISAFLGELPLAALLFYASRRLIRLTIRIAWHRQGRTGPVPPLRHISLFALLDTHDPTEDQPP